MKLEVRKARAAAVAANLAAQAAVAARELLAEDPSAWEVGDAAYWLCRATQKACESAADTLDPEEAETSAERPSPGAPAALGRPAGTAPGWPWSSSPCRRTASRRGCVWSSRTPPF